MTRLKWIFIGCGIPSVGLMVWISVAAGYVAAGMMAIALLLIGVVLVYVLIARPLQVFDRQLDAYIENSHASEAPVRIRPEDAMILKKIKTVIDRYANRKASIGLAGAFDKQAELAALQSQINPHFLYNTLETIRGQALIDDNGEIAKMVEALAAFFRYSISRSGDLVTLRDELANIRNYMMIQQYRFNNRFTLGIFVDDSDEDAYDSFIPKLILQPIVENALFHGLEESVESGRVLISIQVTQSNLMVTVSDNGKGIDQTKLMELNRRIKDAGKGAAEAAESESIGTKHTGIALRNIHRRLRLLFGDEYGLTVYSTLNQGTDVELIMPMKRERTAL